MNHAELKILSDQKLGQVSRYLYGHFTEHLGRCIYDGIFVGKDSDIPNENGIRKDVLEAFRALHVPVLRWPGGCFADEYHWRDGIGDPSARRKTINTNWGYVVEDNSFGTHEFMDLCEKIGADPYIAGNLGSGTVQEMSEWIEYMTSDSHSDTVEERRKNGREEPWKVPFFGIGNESWGGGGCMRPEYYADLYRRYQNFCKSGSSMQKIACGPNCDDYAWTETIMQQIKPNQVDAISLHYYTCPNSWDKKGSAVEYTPAEYYSTISKALYMDELLTEHSKIMDKYDPLSNIKLVVDEWGCWYDVQPGTNPSFLYQQNTMRDAIMAACTLHIFHKHCDRLKMANLAQAVNVLQSLLLTDGQTLIKTPTYHVFRMLASHQDGELLATELSDSFETGDERTTIPGLSCSATLGSDGRITLSMVNCSLNHDCVVELNVSQVVSAEILTSTNVTDHNDTVNPELVSAKPYEGFFSMNGRTTVTVPKCSVIVLKLR